MSFSGSPPPLPAFIMEKLAGEEFVKIPAVGPTAWTVSGGPKNRVADDGVSQPSQCYLPAELKAKIVQGDYQALASARKQNQADLQPNLSSIQNSTDTQSVGFVTVTDTTSGQDYRICASDSGWIWTYTVSITAKQSNGKLVNQCVVQTGTYSASAKWLGISYLTFKNEATVITAIGVAGFAALIVGNMVKNMVLGYIYEQALTSAVAAAEAGAVEGGFMTSETAALVWSSLAGGIAGAIVGALVGLVVYFISDFLHKSYGLTTQIYNWDTEEEWSITQWHADNAVVADGAKGSGPWKAVSLLPVQNSVPGPFGAIPATQPVAQYAGYAFRNNHEWLEGLGLAMSVSSNTASFYMGYEVRRFLDNRIGLSSNTNETMTAWYDGDNWQPSGATSYNGSLDGRPDLTVTIITDALNGSSVYNCDIHIGLLQSVEN